MNWHAAVPGRYRVSRRISTDAKHANTKPSACFAIYGFDIFLDRKLNPFVIEVNRSPSFSCDSPLDRDIKFVDSLPRMLPTEAFALLRPQHPPVPRAHTCGTVHDPPLSLSLSLSLSQHIT